MTRSIRKGSLIIALLALPLATGTANAGPGADVAVVTGNGTIRPGLSTECTVQAVTFSGSAEVLGTHPGTYSVSFSGGSISCETNGFGAGTGTLSGGVSGTVNYSRTGNIVTLNGSGAIGTHARTIIAAVCEFVPTSVDPTTTYALACQVALGPL